MPRNASGTYALPSGNPVSSGTLIDATWANNTLNDLANEMTDSLSRSGEGGMLAPFRLNDGVQATPGLAFSNEPSTGLYRAGTNEMWAVVGGTQVQQFTSNGAATRFALGAVTTPSLTFLGDLNTGLWSPAADTIAASVGGAEAFRVTSTGAFGIGTTPTNKLDVLGVNGEGIQFRTGTRTVGIGQISSQAALFWGSTTDLTFFSGSELARLTSSGNLGIGTASPLARLQVKSSLAQAVNIEGTTARGGGSIYAAFLDTTGRKGFFGYAATNDTFFVTNEMSDDILFQTNNLNRMRIDANGNVIAGSQVALATNATNGFLYVPTCAGTPTGTPAAITGMAPIVINTTNNKLYFYSGGAWRDAGP